MCKLLIEQYTCKCTGATYAQKCQRPSKVCTTILPELSPVDMGKPCRRHTSKLITRQASKKATSQPKNAIAYYPPTSFPSHLSRGLSISQFPTTSKSRRSTVPKRTPTSPSALKRSSPSSPISPSSIYSDASLPRSARSRASSYTNDLDHRVSRLTFKANKTLTLEQAHSLEEAHASLRSSLELEAQRTKMLDTHVAPPMDSLLSPLSPASVTRNASMKLKAARIRASLEKEHHPALINLTTNATPTPTRPASTPAKPSKSVLCRSSISTRKPRPSPATYQDRHHQLQPRASSSSAYPPSSYKIRPTRHANITDYESKFEYNSDIDPEKLSESEKYALFLEKDRLKTEAARQRRAESKAGIRPGVREKSDGICSVM